MLFRNIGLTLALTSVASTLVAPCAPEPPEMPHWSDGNYALQSAYVFSFGAAPYVMTFAAATSGDDALGNVWGEFRWVFWLDSDSFSSGNPADCIFTESLVGEGSQAGATSLDYSQCDGCEPYSLISSFDAELSGPNCTDDLIEFFETSAFTQHGPDEYRTVWGYRHAPSHGWPEEFSAVVDDLEAAGYEGTMYDPFTTSATLVPLYVVAPLPEGGTRSMSALPDLPLPPTQMLPATLDSRP